MTTTTDLMARIGETTVMELLGSYAALLDEKQELEHEALALRNAGVSLGSSKSLENCQARRDVDRRLGLYRALEHDAALLGVTS